MDRTVVAPRPARGLARVVVAHDQVPACGALRALLAAEPDLAVAGESCGRVLDACAALRPDLVLLEWGSAALDWFVATRALTAAHPTVPVLVLGAGEDPDHALLALWAGAAGYVRADADPRQIVAVVRQLLGTRRPPAPPLSLAPDEAAVLRLVAAGDTDARIAATLGRTPGAIARTLGAIRGRAGLRGRAARAAPPLTTAEGGPCARRCGRAGGAAGAAGSHEASAGARFAAAARLALRAVWREGGRPWDRVLAHHRPRNLAIARAYLETDEPVGAIAARHGVTPQRVLPIARAVAGGALGRRRPPH